MELVEGESPKGQLPFDEAWKIATQIADVCVPHSFVSQGRVFERKCLVHQKFFELHLTAEIISLDGEL